MPLLENAILYEKTLYDSHIELRTDATVCYDKVKEYLGSFLVDCSSLMAIEYVCEDIMRMAFCKPDGYHISTRPHSIRSANESALSSLLLPGDKILAVGRQFTNNLYQVVLCDDDADIAAEVEKHKPNIVFVVGEPRTKIFDFKSKLAGINVPIVVDITYMVHLILSGLHPSPLGIADIVTSSTRKLRGAGGAIVFYKNEDFEGYIRDDLFIPLIVANTAAIDLATTFDFCEYTKNCVKNAQIMAQQLININENAPKTATDIVVWEPKVEQIERFCDRLYAVSVMVNKDDSLICMSPSCMTLKGWEPSDFRRTMILITDERNDFNARKSF